MPIATIELNDGRRVKVEVPEGATQEQIGAFVQQNLSSISAPPEQPRQTRRGQRQDRAPQDTIDPFAGLPQDTVSGIEESFPMPEGNRVRGGQRIGVRAKREQAAELEQIRKVNPQIAKLIEETGGVDAFLIGAGRGLSAIPRAFGAAEESDIEKQAIEGLRSQSPQMAAGEVVGETAPFAAVGGPLVGLGKTAAQRAALTGALGAAEGGTITAAEGGDAKDIALGATIGGVAGFLPSVGGVSSKLGTGEARRDSLKAAKDLLRVSKRDIDKAVSEAAPSIDQLKSASRDIYNNIEAAGVSIDPQSYERLVRSTLNDAKGLGYRPSAAGKKINPESSNVIDLIGEFDDSVSVADLEDVRKAAQQSASAASRAGRNQDAAISGALIDNIDEFLSSITSSDVRGNAANIGEELSAARKLWGKARKQELLDEAFGVGEARAAGAERGIRNEFNKILNNKKKARYFSEAEKNAMLEVVKGTPSANTFRRLGQMGFGSGQQTNVTGGAVSSIMGSSIMGPIGAMLFPAVGAISKNLAERLTKNNAKLAGQYVRAGSDADKIARLYLSSTPKAQRSAEELAQLLMRPDISLKGVNANDFVSEAIPIAQRMREAIPQAAATTAAVSATLPAAAESEE